MSNQKDTNSNLLGFALEILKLLAQKPQKKAELIIALGDRGFAAGDLSQKITRTITRLRDCGFDIKGAPNRPYELVDSRFPVILSTEQRQALAMAAELLADMGFAAQAGHISRIGNFSNTNLSNLAADFYPPANYSEENLDEILQELQQRLQQKRRFVVWYRNSRGDERNWDVDKSELRLHNGSLYLFAFVPDWYSWNIPTRPNVEQNSAFRVDRIIRIGAASQTPWTYTKFPTIDITYRLTGALATYKPRRPHEQIVSSPENTEYVDILTKEDYIFWFQQRILQYGASATVLSPPWIAQQVKNAHQQAYENYY